MKPKKKLTKKLLLQFLSGYKPETCFLSGYEVAAQIRFWLKNFR